MTQLESWKEAYRLLKNAGLLHIRVVYWNHKYSFSDPTHVKFFTEIIWEFFTGKRRQYYTKAIFVIEKLEYTYDSLSMKVFRSKRVVKFLFHFLCNMIDGMRITFKKT